MQGIIKVNNEPLFFDIETLPTTDKKVIERIGASIKPPGTIKKKESIDAWMAENYEQELKKEIHKTGLNGAYGSVACIAWNDGFLTTSSFKNMSEHEVISDFYETIENTGIDTFSGHNIAGFDLKFLKQRSMILGIKPPKNILKAMNAKPWDDCIKDIMLMWDSDKNKMASLEMMCWWFGVKHGMPDMDGSMVAETWYKDPQKVIDYCVCDVKAEREIYYKMMFETSVF